MKSGKISDLSTVSLKESSNIMEQKVNSSACHRITQIITDFVIIAIIAGIFGIVYYTVDPKISYFYCHETDIFYPYLVDAIPFWAVGIFGVLGPVLVILIVETLNVYLLKTQRVNGRNGLKTFLIHFFHAISLFLMGAVTTVLLTEIGKRWVGRLRPYFMSVCKPNYSTLNCTSNGLTGIVYNPIYTGGSFCTGDAKKVKEARYSFPSGHSSFSWYTMLYTIIFLEARFVRLRLRYVKCLIQMACFITAFVTMLSRVSDYHHRYSDVLAGGILGCLIALFITLVSGRFLFTYNRTIEHKEIDLKPTVD